MFTNKLLLSREANGSISVYLMLYCKSSRKENLFLNTVGKNPLNLEVEPEIENWGRIMYCNVINVTDDEAVDRVEELYRKAYAEIQKFIQ